MESFWAICVVQFYKGLKTDAWLTAHCPAWIASGTRGDVTLVRIVGPRSNRKQKASDLLKLRHSEWLKTGKGGPLLFTALWYFSLMSCVRERLSQLIMASDNPLYSDRERKSGWKWSRILHSTASWTPPRLQIFRSKTLSRAGDRGGRELKICGKLLSSLRLGAWSEVFAGLA